MDLKLFDQASSTVTHVSLRCPYELFLYYGTSLLLLIPSRAPDNVPTLFDTTIRYEAICGELCYAAVRAYWRTLNGPCGRDNRTGDTRGRRGACS
jgi:hypothetical protein